MRRGYLSRDLNEVRDCALKPPGGCRLLVRMVPRKCGRVCHPPMDGTGPA